MNVPAKKTETAIALPPASPPSIADNLLPMLREILTNPAISPERVTQTLDFYERMDKLQGKKEFDAAIADAKAEFEPIIKRRVVERGGTAGSYKHEDLADIDGAVRPAMSKYGLNYRYRASSNPNEPIRVTCVITHRQGYSEETTLSAGADSSGGKNTIQAIGSTVTYLQRYTLRLALGLAAARDDDGRASAVVADNAVSGSISVDQVKEIQELCIAKGTKLPIFYKIFGISNLREMTSAQYGVAKNMLKMKKGKE